MAVWQENPVASYVGLHESGQLEHRVDAAWEILSSCRLCPRRCGVDRLGGETGYCGGGEMPKISSYGPHFGEEPPLVGFHGSGTIFFTGCTMRCAFCQNYEISQDGIGREVSCEYLARTMLLLQERGCHNINFVTPTHFVPQILRALTIAVNDGLTVPLVYNTGTYDSVDTLRILDGIFDIYMPDAKYGSDDVAIALSDAPRYVEIMQDAIVEMQRQVGDLVTVEGVATRGLIIRHLVLPGNLAQSEEVFRFIAENVSIDAYVNIMDQYHPCGRVRMFKDDPRYDALTRRLSPREFFAAVEAAKRAGLHRGIPLGDE
ncbi:MAG: radical SAM protein [Methanolinea sp.]|nr:radical SAM protein [Methanolinea sp.]